MFATCNSSDDSERDATVATTTTSEALASTTTASQGLMRWVAVYKAEPYGEDERTAFLREAGTAAFEGPVGCFAGLADALGVSNAAQVLAAVAPSEAEARAGLGARPPALVRQFPSSCVD